MNYDTIKPYIEKKLVSEQSHPLNPNIRIFNYTQHCQFEQAWDDVTKQCRGLIMNVETGDIIARPFSKFFNYQEHIQKGWEIPAEQPIITEKMDGSLGILYWIPGDAKPWIATRGSFTSDQAVWATKWFRDNVDSFNIPRSYTHLFEIIYPENRIVVNYDFSGLVLIAIVPIHGQYEITMHDSIWNSYSPAMRIVKTIPNTNLEELAKMDEPNSEGFVAFYPSANMRLKLKFPEYVRLHKLVTGLSEIAIWEHMRDGQLLDALIEKVPDEFFKWVKSVSEKLQARFNKIEEWAEDDYQKAIQATGIANLKLGDPIPTDKRKDFAFETTLCKYPQLMFARLDGKPVAPIIWKMIRPNGAKSFKIDSDA